MNVKAEFNQAGSEGTEGCGFGKVAAVFCSQIPSVLSGIAGWSCHWSAYNIPENIYAFVNTCLHQRHGENITTL